MRDSSQGLTPRESLRAFISVEMSDEARERLAQAIDSLSRLGLSGVRWVKPEGMHLTLKFLGDIDPSLVEKVTEAIELAARDTEPFMLSLSQPGGFPTLGDPRVLWVGLVGDLERLYSLQRAVESQMQRLGFSAEKRRFSAHVTVGRVREGTRVGERRRIGDAFSRIAVDDVSAWRVEAVHLMRSILTPAGAIYTRLLGIPLAEVLPENWGG